MTAKNILKMIQNGEKINVIDVRSPERFENFHIEGAINIDKGKIIGEASKILDKSQKYYLTCNSGNSGGLITKILLGQGYDVENVEGGMNPLVRELG